jgi:hypothetical protein
MVTRYPEGDLILSLTQAVEDGILRIELMNQSSRPIESGFPQRRFEGYVMLIQEGEIPVKFYEETYFDALIHGIRFNPPVRLDPNDRITYEVPLELLRPLEYRRLATEEQIMAFAVLDGFEVTSNVINLEHCSKIGGQNQVRATD